MHSIGPRPGRDPLPDARKNRLADVLREIEEAIGDPADVVVDEETFIRRFGFDANEPARMAVLRIKSQHDLTDRQIRWLRWTGHLTISRETAVAAASTPQSTWGWILVVTLSFSAAIMAGAAILTILRGHAVAIMPLVGVITALAALSMLAFQVHIRPSQWLRRTASRDQGTGDGLSGRPPTSL